MKKIVIRKLFGRFDYDISLSKTGMTILTGPNGFGKSTILLCVRAMAEGNINFFQKLNFKEIKVITENKKNNITIHKDEGDLCINGKRVSEFLKADEEKNNIPPMKIDFKRAGRKSSENDELLFKAYQILHSNRKQDSTPDFVIWNDQNNATLQYCLELMNTRPSLFQVMHQSVGELFYISEQRLIRPAEGEWRRKSGGEALIVREEEEIPGKLKSEISRVAERYSNVANRLDSTFPQRLFAERNGITRQEFNTKMAVMQDKVEKLKKYDISDIGELEDIQFKEEDARALKVYFEDFEKKYQQYETLIRKLDMFTDMINVRFLFKEAKISKEEGLQVFDSDTGKELELSELSSGEKETLVLFYQLLFDVPDGAMLLVDEPEISLHIAWQRMFADDLMRIVEYKHMKALVATHSPQIVNGRRDIQIDLGELYEKRLHTEK